MARVFADDLAAVDGASLTAVASRTLDGATAFASAYPGVGAHPNLTALLASGDVDVVYVCTPPHRHAEDCLQSIASGVPVLCEKPFAGDAATAAEVVAAARVAGVFCMEAMWMRFLPAVRTLSEMVVSGRIGDPRVLMADFGMANVFDPTHRYFDPERGGGALLDRGVYTVALAVMLFGVPDELTSLRTTVPTGVDGDSGLLLHFPGERLAVLSSSLTSWTSNTATVSGTGGRLVLQEPFHRSERLTLTPYTPIDLTPPSDPPPPPSRKESTIRSVTAGPLGPPLRKVAASRPAKPLVEALKRRLHPSPDETIELPIEGVGYGYEAAEVVRCLRTGATESPAMPLDETLHVMRIMDEAHAQWAARAR